MAGYDIHTANGTVVNIPENSIDSSYYDGTSGVQLVGRNAIDYGAPIAQNFLQLLENFASPNSPQDAPIGALWYNTIAGTINLRTSTISPNPADDWKPVITSGGAGGGTITVEELIVTTIGTTGDPVENIYGTNFHGGTFFGTATKALYADLAERYEADAVYGPGTLVSLGGEKEITITKVASDISVFGIVSTNPGLMLNCEAGDNNTHPYIALTGRVPVKVTGIVRKGSRLVSSEFPGVAKAAVDGYYDVQAVVGRALEDKTTDGIEQILAVVGVK